MESVPVRSLRNQSAEVLERVMRGESLTVTRDGTAVAMLGPVPRPVLGAADLIARFRHLPPVDSVALRRDVDALIDQAL